MTTADKVCEVLSEEPILISDGTFVYNAHCVLALRHMTPDIYFVRSHITLTKGDLVATRWDSYYESELVLFVLGNNSKVDWIRDGF